MAFGLTQDAYRNGVTMLIALEAFVEGVLSAGDIADRRDVIALLRTDI